jgi:hypothetical protein
VKERWEAETYTKNRAAVDSVIISLKEISKEEGVLCTKKHLCIKLQEVPSSLL